MRTTVTLSEDVAAALRQVQRERGVGISAAVDELVRRGLAAPATRTPFVQRTHAMGMKLDVRNIGEVLDALDGPGDR